MRLVLLYPPPWKIPLPGAALDPHGDGPPEDFQPGDLDADFFQTPYGLFTLGAQALDAGHQVKVFNLSGFAWEHVEHVIASLEADVWGLSCWTANRRGMALVAAEIKKRHPKAVVVVGGPHATPLGRELLEHHADIDVVTRGESEGTLLELLERVASGSDFAGLAGSMCRANGRVLEGPERPSMRNLDELACVQKYFGAHIMMTSRGCPWACTFCGAETSWGRGFRAHSTEYTLDALERLLPRLPVKMVQVKDDTFTTHKKRVLELCRGIRARGLKFLWSCDTRVDVLSEELLYEMRLAGCERLSLGVESGSPRVLEAIDKKITVEEIIASTELAKKYGLQVRYYMMIGNRGETRETFAETLAFLHRARPHQYLFSCLSIYPGTRDFHDAEAAGIVHREEYFTGKFQELKVPFDAPPEEAAWMADWFARNKGLKHLHRPDSAELAAVSARLGDYAPAVLDLAAALLQEGALAEADAQLARAEKLGHPNPGLVHNHRAVLAYRQGDLARMQDEFTRGVERDPQHPVLLENVARVYEWMQRGGARASQPLALLTEHSFSLLERTAQPSLPGPVEQDFASWDAPTTPRIVRAINPAEVVRERRRLMVVA